MRKTATILVALMLAWAGIKAQAQSTWKQTEREHVVPSVVEDNMGDVVRCQLPETIVKGPIKVGLTAGEQAEYIQSLWEKGESPRLYAAIFFRRPKETGEALYKKVVEKGDRILTQKGKNWVEALDVVNQKSNELSYTFTYLDDAQAEFWLVTAIGYGEGYQKGFAWDVLHYIRKVKASKEDEDKKDREPLQIQGEQWIQPEEFEQYMDFGDRPSNGVGWKDENLPLHYHGFSMKDPRLRVLGFKITSYNIEWWTPMVNGPDGHHYYPVDNPKTICIYLKEKNSPANISLQYQHTGPVYADDREGDPNARHKTEQLDLSFSNISLYHHNWVQEELNPQDSLRYDFGIYFSPVGIKNYLSVNFDFHFYELSSETYPYRDYPNWETYVWDGEGHSMCYSGPFVTKCQNDNQRTTGLDETGKFILRLIYSGFPCKKTYKYQDEDDPERIEEEEHTIHWMIESFFTIDGILIGDIDGIPEDEGSIIDPEQKDELRSILDELMGWLKNENDALGEHTSAKESVVYNIIAVILSILVGSGGGGIPSPQPDGTTPSRGKKKEDEKGYTPRFKPEVLKELGDQYVKERNDGTLVVIDPVTGKSFVCYPTNDGKWESEWGTLDANGIVNELRFRQDNAAVLRQDAADAAKNLAEQRAQNEAQWERERKTGVTETSRRHTEWKQKYLAEEAKKERMRKLEEEFGTTDKATLMEKMKEKQAALEEVARKDKITAAVWTAITGVTWAIDKGCDVAINVMGEIGGPGAKALKNAYTLAKAPLKRVAEAHVYNKGDEQAMKTAAWQGVTEGLFGVLQNEAGRFSKSLGGWGEMTAVVGGEAAKGALNAYIQGGNMTDIAKEAAWAGAQKSVYYGIGKGVSALSKVKKDADAAPLVKKINDLQIKKLDLLEKGNIKEAVKVMQERGDTMRALGKLGKLGERLATKNASASQEFGAEFGVNPVTDGVYVDAFKEAANALRSVMN